MPGPLTQMTDFRYGIRFIVTAHPPSHFLGGQPQSEDLSSQVQQLRHDNQAADKTLTASFSKLYDKFSDLQSKVQNPELLKEIKETKQELADSQKQVTTLLVNPQKAFLARSAVKIC